MCKLLCEQLDKDGVKDIESAVGAVRSDKVKKEREQAARDKKGVVPLPLPTVSTPKIGPLQTLDQDLRPQQIALPEPTNMFKRPNILCCYGVRRVQVSQWGVPFATPFSCVQHS